VLTWGISDAHSWVPSFFKGCGAALLCDEEFQPKPAYYAVQQALQELPHRQPPARAVQQP